MSKVRRRNYLYIIGVSPLVGIAGCAQFTNDEESGSTPTPSKTETGSSASRQEPTEIPTDTAGHGVEKTDVRSPTSNTNTSPSGTITATHPGTSTPTPHSGQTTAVSPTPTTTKEEQNDSSDTEGPVTHDFTLSSREFEPGDEMQIHVEVTDESGIERLYFRFEHQDGGGAVFDAYQDYSSPADSGTHTITYKWPDGMPGGEYEATWIYARDSIGNTASWEDSFSAPKKRIQIDSESSDTEGPVVHDFTLSSREFEPGDEMQIDVEVTDESGIERLYFRFEHEDGGGAVYDAYQDYSPPVESGTYTITYQWPENTPGGTYEVTWIYAKDSVGNNASWEDSFPSSKKQIQIDSESSDTEGPVIHDFTLSSREFEPGDEMQIDVEATDESGIERLYFRFEHQEGGGAVYDAYRDYSPPVESGTHTIDYQWPQDTPSGTYEATWIYAKDSVGNNASWEDSFASSKKQVEIE